MTPESCRGETSTSACRNHKAALAAPRRSAHHEDDLWYRVRLAPHLSHLSLREGLFQSNDEATYASSSYLEGHEVLIVSASITYLPLISLNVPSAYTVLLSPKPFEIEPAFE